MEPHYGATTASRAHSSARCLLVGLTFAEMASLLACVVRFMGTSAGGVVVLVASSSVHLAALPLFRDGSVRFHHGTIRSGQLVGTIHPGPDMATEG